MNSETRHHFHTNRNVKITSYFIEKHDSIKIATNTCYVSYERSTWRSRLRNTCVSIFHSILHAKALWGFVLTFVFSLCRKMFQRYENIFIHEF